MSTSDGSRAPVAHSESPDPASHARNLYDEPPNERHGEDDDDDMDYEPITEDSDGNEFFDPEEDEEVEFHDAAEDDLSGVEIEFRSIEEDYTTEEPDDEEGSGTPTEADARPTRLAEASGRTRIQVPSQILQLLGHAGMRRLLSQSRFVSNAGDNEDDADHGYGNGSSRGRRKKQPKCSESPLPKVPSEEGQRLMETGLFGTSVYYRDRRSKRKTKLSRKLLSRETGNDRGQSMRAKASVVQDLLPSSAADTIINYNSRCYSGQFSDDGNFFFSCAQDMKVRMYDTSNPYAWKYYKTVAYHYGQWTITDASLSPDNKYLAYSSIRSQVCLAPTDPNEDRDPWMLDFSDMGQDRRAGRYHYHSSHFGIWSIRFSGDGREIVAGTSNNSVYVYDIEKRQSILRIPGHNDDVNAVCFGDTSSPHILYSGSDDTLIKVWDRRSMGDSREAGVFMGHTEGLTYVDSKGDGRYVLSNGKDQSMKLWDLRKMMSTEKASTVDPSRYTTAFDYRYMNFSDADWLPHPYDCSLVTYRGHSVLKTLIRCHFSPPGSTNSRYVYTGSQDGSIYIYNMDATLAGTVDVGSATYHSRPRNPRSQKYTMDGDLYSRDDWETCVRDASWHPNAPMIAATSWNGWGQSTGTCSTHSWNDGAEDDEGITPKMGLRVDQKLRPDERLSDTGEPRRTGLRSQRVQQAVLAEDDDDEEEEVDGAWW